MPSPVFTKLNFKNQPEVYVLNAPDAFLPAVEAIRPLTNVRTSLGKTKEADFLIAFATKKSEVDAFAVQAAAAAAGDAIVWVAYPKGTSKRYRCDFNRDNGFDGFGANGFEPVRMVAIDEDWSALRFRRVEFIKTMTRSFAMTAEGKEKAGKRARRPRVR